MNVKLSLALRAGVCAALATAVPFATGATDTALATRRVQAHATFLADDLLEGRGTGSRGYALAALYVSSQFARLGLEPGADNGSYQQPVAMLEARSSREDDRFIIQREGSADDALIAMTDMIIAITPGATSATVTAPAVFVGFGVEAPAFGYDDFVGVDLRGKIAVVLAGAPRRFPSEPRAHFSEGSVKLASLAKRGAVGMVVVPSPREMARRPWALSVTNAGFASMRLVGANGTVLDGFPEVRVTALVNGPAAHRLFVAAPHPLETAVATSERSEAQSFPLNLQLTLAGQATVRTVESANVLGWLPGTDHALAGEPIVVTGHLDHLGLGRPVDGDAIYNGALDNAIGIGLLLNLADELASGPRLRRPVLFAAVTAEEKGKLGSQHLAFHPPARVQRYAANLNIDMALFLGPVRDIIAYGAPHTTLGQSTSEAAARCGFTVSPDPMPDRVIFIGSDQYSFVRAGVPAIYLKTGQRSTDPTADLATVELTFRNTRYHQPSDDLAHPVDWPSVGAFGGLLADLTQSVANDAQAPAWLPGDFFGELFDPDRQYRRKSESQR